jgi:hypothetical protein
MGSFLRIPTLVNADEKAYGAILQTTVKLKESLKSDTYLNTFCFSLNALKENAGSQSDRLENSAYIHYCIFCKVRCR